MTLPWQDAHVDGLARQLQSVRDVGAGNSVVEVDFGAGMTALGKGTRVLDLRPRKRGIVPADGPVRWEALDALPQLLTVEWAGPDRGIVEAVAARPNIKFLYWFDAEGDIDLSSTRVGTVRLDGLNMRSIRLPRSIESLSLGRAPAHFDVQPPRPTVSRTLRVDAPDGGHRLDLRMFHYDADVVIPEGVRRASSLWLWLSGQVSASVLLGLCDMETLRLSFDRPPGAITDLAGLRTLTALCRLQLDEAYGLTVEELPDLPALRALELNGTRRVTAHAVKARYRGSAVSVNVSGAKTDQWLSLHMDNPFRDWVHDSKAFGRAACAAYDRARRSADAIGADDPQRLALAEEVLRGLVADLNAIENKYHLIDTHNRETAGDAFHDLAHRLGVASVDAHRWFDGGRNF
ncbi:hypothetical protein AB0M47_04740 [Hamadaea sp. NPDC051192]|uniref:hypothetical protein n=1 Tax=Hamadaea sp. NPDC051192 TaxID=3154940 RepID=UPI00344633D7